MSDKEIGTKSELLSFLLMANMDKVSSVDFEFSDFKKRGRHISVSVRTIATDKNGKKYVLSDQGERRFTSDGTLTMSVAVPFNVFTVQAI